MESFIETLALFKFSSATQSVVEAYQEKLITFDDELIQSCIGANFTSERMELLKICADRLTTNPKEKDMVMSFIRTLDTMIHEHIEKVCEENDLKELLEE